MKYTKRKAKLKKRQELWLKGTQETRYISNSTTKPGSYKK